MADTFNSTVNKGVGVTYVKYDGSIDLTGNLEDSHYTQAFLIAEANNADAGFTSVASGGGGTNGDVLVSLEVSNDKENWKTVSTTLADHDATATVHATLGGTNFEDFHAYKWARFVADGQTSNDYTTIDWSANLTKNEGVASYDKATLIGGDVADSIGD